MKALIITIGDELLIGQTIDTNSSWIGAELSKLGFDIYRMISVHDRGADILSILNETHKIADVVIITGGLGPTSDDITKQVLCDWFGGKLTINNEVLEMISAMVTKRGFIMNENNRKQALVPDTCRALLNETGTAPGMWFEKDNCVYVSLPGVPFEMKHIMNQRVIPELSKRFNTQAVYHRNILTYGEPEARLADTLENFESELPPFIKLAYLPAMGVIKLRLTAIGISKEIIKDETDKQAEKLYNIIPHLIFGEGNDTMESVIGRLLREKGMSLATAESCTGGKIASLITSVPGCSDYFKGSIIAYSNEVKVSVLEVEDRLITENGAVSSPVVEAMASGARRVFRADYAVATSGIAGPDGGTPEKPVGTLWVALASPTTIISEKFNFANDRNVNISRFSSAALNLLLKKILTT